VNKAVRARAPTHQGYGGAGQRGSGRILRDQPDEARSGWENVTVSVAPTELERPDIGVEELTDVPWVTIVWNDPVNLMSYVTYVFQTYFGYSKKKATKLMLDVHHKGRAVVSTGTREEMERDVTAMHGFGLWATLQKDTAP
jgi:ATP-dependent Clp protease adaptor protein ClpS